MNFKNTWLWLFLAAGLFAFIFFFQRHAPKEPTGPARVLPELKAAAVTSVQVIPKNHWPIRAERTNHSWALTSPLPYPAQSVSIENLLAALERLTPAAHISEAELTNRFNVDQDYGFADPDATLLLEQKGLPPPRLRFGMKTAPGDQFFLQVVGKEGFYVVDADLLKLLPRSTNDWRDTTFCSFTHPAFDRIAVTNGSKAFVLARETTNHLWRMVYPFVARANNPKINDCLQRLASLRVRQFVSDQPRADLEAMGLQPAELELALAQGTNASLALRFGKSPTNDAQQVYAKRANQSHVVTVSKDLLAPWYTPGGPDDFRDPRLLTLTAPIETITVQGEDTFSLQFQADHTWRVLPQNFQADAALANDLFATLANLNIARFEKENVTDLGWSEYGLACPSRRYLLKSPATNSAGGLTNLTLAELSFGTNAQDIVFARRADERSVYGVRLADVQRLPWASWQLRQRRLWSFSEKDVFRVTVRHDGKQRQLVHNGEYEWSLAPGSQGIIDSLRVEETVRGVVQASAVVWVACGEPNPARYGIAENGLQLTLELKSGDKALLQFGKEAPSTHPYAAVTLDGKLWVLEFPFPVFRDVLSYLTIRP